MKLLPLLALVLLISACAGKDVTFMGDAKADYAKAKEMLANGKYDKANIFLEQFVTNHPYSHYSVQAELLRAFAAYKNEEHVLVEVLCEQFIDRHPRHPDVAYAKYLLAMGHYKQVSPPENDQGETKAAIDAFKLLLKEHPESSYARDGAGRLQKLYNHLAKHEVNVGRFYFDRGRYVAAVNRFQSVIESYQTSPAIEEALYYLAASYAALGIKGSARDTALLLRHNYPRGSWSARAAKFL